MSKLQKQAFRVKLKTLIKCVRDGYPKSDIKTLVKDLMDSYEFDVMDAKQRGYERAMQDI